MLSSGSVVILLKETYDSFSILLTGDMEMSGDLRLVLERSGDKIVRAFL